MLEILNYGGTLAGVAGAVSLIVAHFKTNSARIWREEAEAQKTRADRLITELTEVKERLTELEGYTQTLVLLLSTIDPAKLEEIRITRGL